MATALEHKTEMINKKVDLIVACLVRKQIISSWEFEKIDELSEMRTTEQSFTPAAEEKQK